MHSPALDNITGVLAHQAENRPDHPAVEDEGRVVTYAELRQHVSDAAANLSELGVRRGDIVGVMLPDSPEHITVLGALEVIGAVILPIDRNLPSAEKKTLTKGFDVKAVITTDRHHKTSPVSEECTLLVEAACTRRAVGAEAAPPATDGSQALIIAQSSGTTGTPKRLILTREQFWSRLWSRISAMQMTPDERWLQVPGLTWVTGYRRCLNVFQIGGTVVIDHELEVDGFLDQLERCNITFVCLSPGHLQRMLPLLDGEGPRFPNLRISVSGAPVTTDQYVLSRQKITPNVLGFCGANEVGGVVAASPRDLDKHPDSIGRPLEGIEARVVDPDYRPMPAMEIGQLGYRGPHFPTEYLDNPEATARHFRDGWFYPGDYAAINEEGYIFLMGRTDDAINCEGLMLYPSEIERVLASHPAVAEVAVLGCPHPIHGMVPVAAVVASEFVGRDALDKLCEEELAAAKRPRRIEFLPELPRNHAGKILKIKLAADLCPE